MDDRLKSEDWWSLLDGKRVGVTGATGFLGSRLIEVLSLKTKARVRALVRTPQRANRIGRFAIEMVRGDLASRTGLESLVAGCDIVIHCAYSEGSLKIFT